MVEAAGYVFFFVEAVPVYGGETDGLVCGVYDLMAAGVERRDDVGLVCLSMEGCAVETEAEAREESGCKLRGCE